MLLKFKKNQKTLKDYTKTKKVQNKNRVFEFIGD